MFAWSGELPKQFLLRKTEGVGEMVALDGVLV